MPEDQVKVLSTWLSMFGMRVIIALEEKGVEYEYQEENLKNKSKLLLESNPVHKKVPVLIHNGKPICESLIIVQYINETWSSAKNFFSDSPYERAVSRFWADYVDQKFYNAISRIMWSTPGEKQEEAKKDLCESFLVMEKALQDVAAGKPYFGGDSIGFVDIAFAPFGCWFSALEEIGNFKLPYEKCPRLTAWMKQIWEHPSMKKGLQDPSKLKEGFLELRIKRLAGT